MKVKLDQKLLLKIADALDANPQDAAFTVDRLIVEMDLPPENQVWAPMLRELVDLVTGGHSVVGADARLDVEPDTLRAVFDRHGFVLVLIDPQENTIMAVSTVDGRVAPTSVCVLAGAMLLLHERKELSVTQRNNLLHIIAKGAPKPRYEEAVEEGCGDSDCPGCNPQKFGAVKSGDKYSLN